MGVAIMTRAQSLFNPTFQNQTQVKILLLLNGSPNFVQINKVFISTIKNAISTSCIKIPFTNAPTLV